MKKAVLLVFAVVLVSGCIEDLNNILPSSFVTPKTVEKPPDVLVVQNQRVYPDPVPASIKDGDSEFTFRFEVVHTGDVEDDPAKNVKICLVDSGVCDAKVNIECGVSQEGIEMYPGQVESREWTFTAPTNDQIAGMEATCPIRYNITYSYNATTMLSFDVISADYLKSLQESGESYSQEISQRVGAGPVKIYFNFPEGVIFRGGSKVVFNIVLEDKGSGSVYPGKLTVSFPKEISEINCGKGSSENVNNKNVVSFQDVKFVGKKSNPIRCSVELPGDVKGIKTYYVKARFEYSYSLLGEEDVTIKPVIQ
ncbi:MAG: hypothetical protein GXO63_01950 [Candidatus Micrarchaeota archaeon]|nr:hypothetical protein [Candidatus Micrarchaeota archaeon]